MEETIDASRSPSPSPRSSSRLRSMAPSSSAVESRTVAKRQCSTSSSPVKAPKWVWVLPTSRTRSMAARLCCTVVALKLYAVPASHPSACVEAALRMKELPYERVDLITGVHVLQQTARFGKRTVPALAGDGVRIVGSSAILRWLDGAVPKPPLFPADAEAPRSAWRRPSAGGRRSSSRPPGASRGRRCAAAPATRGATCRARGSRSRRTWRPARRPSSRPSSAG